MADERVLIRELPPGCSRERIRWLTRGLDSVMFDTADRTVPVQELFIAAHLWLHRRGVVVDIEQEEESS